MNLRRFTKSDGAVVGLGVAACAACCAGPLITALAAIGVGLSVVAIALPALALLAAAAFGGVFVLRRRSKAECPKPQGLVDLDLMGPCCEDLVEPVEDTTGPS